MNNLPKEIAQIIDALCVEGDRCAEAENYETAIAKYEEAWNLLPPPHNQWPAATWILMSIADSYFALDQLETAIEFLLDAIEFPDGEDNPFLYLRLGQCLYDTNQLDDAAKALEEALRLGGEQMFEGEEPRYLLFLKNHLKVMKIAPPSNRFNRPLS